MVVESKSTTSENEGADAGSWQDGHPKSTVSAGGTSDINDVSKATEMQTKANDGEAQESSKHGQFDLAMRPKD